MEALINKQIIGIIDGTTRIDSLEPITQHRSVASLPFGGRYRLIDFMLSNMVHAGVDSLSIFSCHQHRSLKEHIGSGKTWDLDRKNGGLFFYVQNPGNKFISKGEIKSVKEFLLRSKQKYVIVARSNIVGRIPLLEVLSHHIDLGVDITNLTYQEKDLSVFLLERKLLLELLEKFLLDSHGYETLLDYIATLRTELEIKDYQLAGPLMVIDSLVSYYRHAMELLNEDAWFAVFSREFPVYTKAKDEPPTKYLPNAAASNSMVANGCVIEGKIENSTISRGVKIGKNTIVRNSIIMSKTVIGDNCILDGVVIDKDVVISDGVILEATNSIPIVIPKGAVVKGELIP